MNIKKLLTYLLLLTAGWCDASVIKVYPSPAKGSCLYFQVLPPTSCTTQITLYNEIGRQVLRSSHEVTNGTNKICVCISALAPGLYFYRVEYRLSDYQYENAGTGKFTVIR